MPSICHLESSHGHGPTASLLTPSSACPPQLFVKQNDQSPELRKRKRLNQTQLATRAKISPRQIARLESEVSAGRTARDRTINNLAEALDVEPVVLTGEMPMPAASARSSREGGPSRHRQVSAWVHPNVGLAYTLIKRRYDVSLTTLVNAAPLMFVLLAEGSFAWRREKLMEVEEATERLDSSGSRHLLSTFVGAGRAADGAYAERQSIESRNLFGEDVLEYLVEDGFPPASTNPFAEYLCELAAKIDDQDIVDVAADIADRGALKNFPEFRICNGDVDKFTAGSERLNLALRVGFLRVDHMPEELLTDEAAEARQQWLERQFEELPEKAREALEELIDLDLGPSEADG